MLGNIILTGGSGKLGQELQKYIDCEAPPSNKLDILDPNKILRYEDADTVIHAAAWTDVPGAEIYKSDAYKTNVVGTKYMAEIFKDKYFIYISTEHAFNPVNFYCKTKLWGEEMVKQYCPRHLIIRTLFKPRPFPYEYAFVDQFTRGDYLDVIAPLIVNAIFREHTGMIFIGTERKTMFELARRSVPNIKGNSIHDIKDVVMPGDYNV